MTVLYGEHFNCKLKERSVCFTGLRDEFLVSDDYFTLNYLNTKGVICKVSEGEKILLVIRKYDSEGKNTDDGMFFSIVRLQLSCGKMAISGVNLQGESVVFSFNDDECYIKVIHVKEI